MYLQTRQSEQQVSYALSARMGLRRAAHRASVGIEMTALLGASALLGLFLAVVVVLPTNDHIQVFSDPGSVTLLQIPAAVLAVAVGTAVAAGWVAAWFVQRQADRADIAKVMRLAR
jgi:ABC-type antimicrobial peptide transport system permease subunit